MTDLYGQSWLNLNGSPGGHVFDVWCQKLSELSADQIAHGFRELEIKITNTTRHGERVHIPNYAEFKGLCLQPKIPACHRMITVQHTVLNNRDKQMGHQTITQIKAMLS